VILAVNCHTPLQTESAAPRPRQAAGETPAVSVVHTAGVEFEKVRVLVVEDDPFVRGGIVRLINGEADLACCGETGSISEALVAVAAQKPGLVLVDLKLADGEAFELITTLQRQLPDLPILVLSQYDEKFYASRVLQAGARGYLMKEAATENLLGAIRMVMDGKIYLSQAMNARLLQKSLAAEAKRKGESRHQRSAVGGQKTEVEGQTSGVRLHNGKRE
jgi:DNA-binding NarL/FixJ family response regulator